MMKMKTKRDQRPLLKQEAPILSDQLDPGGESEEERNESFQQSKQQEQQQQQKKRSWRRLFGKGGANLKRKESNNPQSGIGSSLEGANSLPSFSQSSDDAEDEDHHDHSQRASSFAEPSKQRSQSEDASRNNAQQSDKRDDITESSQNTSNHIKEVLESEPPTPAEYKARKSTLNVVTQDRISISTNATPKSAMTQPHRNHASPGHTTASSSSGAHQNSGRVSRSMRSPGTAIWTGAYLNYRANGKICFDFPRQPISWVI
jgi:hypothetical protein